MRLYAPRDDLESLPSGIEEELFRESHFLRPASLGVEHDPGGPGELLQMQGSTPLDTPGGVLRKHTRSSQIQERSSSE